MKNFLSTATFSILLVLGFGIQATPLVAIQTDERPQNDEAVEKAIEEVAEEVESALQDIGRSLESSADRLGLAFERWAEDNSEELDAWSAKYAKRWERWANGLEKKMQRVANEQEGVWNEWANDYEQKWQTWSEELESDEIDSVTVRKLVQNNLKMLSKMPLGQMVDELLEEGLGELSEAPWESLDELGRLAERALDEPIQEIEKMAEPGSEDRRRIERGVRDLQDALGKIGDEVEQRMTREIEAQRVSERERMNARIRALNSLLKREGITDRQKRKIEGLINTLRDAESLIAGEDKEGDLSTPRQNRNRASRQRNSQDSRQKRDPRGREELPKAKRPSEDEDLDQFNEDLRRSRSESGKQSAEERRNKSKKALEWFAGKQAKSTENEKRNDSQAELDLLREEIQKLRREIEKLKKGR